MRSHSKGLVCENVGQDAFVSWTTSAVNDLGMSSEAALFGRYSELPRDRLVGVCASFGHSRVSAGHLVDSRYEWAYGKQDARSLDYSHGVYCLHSFVFGESVPRGSLEGFTREGAKYNTWARLMEMDSKEDLEMMLACSGCAHIRTQLLPCEWCQPIRMCAQQASAMSVD